MFCFGPFSIHDCIYLSFSAYMQDIYFHDSKTSNISFMGKPRFTFGPCGDNSRPWGIADNEEGNSEDGQGFHLSRVSNCFLHTDRDYSQISFGWGYKCFVCVLIRIWTESDYSHLSETKPWRIQVRSGLKIGGGAAEPVIPQCFSILYKPNHTIRH